MIMIYWYSPWHTSWQIKLHLLVLSVRGYFLIFVFLFVTMPFIIFNFSHPPLLFLDDDFPYNFSHYFWELSINPQLHLNSRVLKCLKRYVLRDTQGFEWVESPFEFRFIIILLKPSLLCLWVFRYLWKLLVRDNFELTEERSFLFAVKFDLQVLQGDFHGVMLLDVNIKLNASVSLLLFDIFHLEVAMLRTDC